jgi:chromate reductase, NAD(P)H dehydrogenase (quinone)
MITVISGTNRPDSNTLKIAKEYVQLMEEQGVSVQLFSLEDLPREIAFTELFNNRSTRFQQIIDRYILPAEKFVIISPEYNGSYPGILKTFLDAMHPDLNRGKKVGLIGVSNGRAGNLRGLDHLTGVLHYLGMHVHPNRLPVSVVSTLLDDQGKLRDEYTRGVLKKHAGDVVNW